jgi:predicted nucleic acid-binding protein
MADPQPGLQPDALILATAVELRAREILTFDERWRSLDPRVRVLTP